MKFTNYHLEFFKADKGAFSVITDTEFSDSQLTFTDAEAEIILDFFGEKNLQRGPVKNNPDLSKKAFNLYGSDSKVFLNVVFPKEQGSEIRLYLSKKADFKPLAGDIWFIFKKSSDLWIGSLSKAKWDKLGLSKGIGRDDEADYYYQETIHTSDKKRIVNLKSKDIFHRDRNLALERMRMEKFTCEVNKDHDLFISRFSGNPYLESHHLIPLGSNNYFDMSLDALENIFCLCPSCHRAIHHAEEIFAKTLVDSLLDKRNVLEKFSLDKTDLYYLYSI